MFWASDKLEVIQIFEKPKNAWNILLKRKQKGNYCQALHQTASTTASQVISLHRCKCNIHIWDRCDLINGKHYTASLSFPSINIISTDFFLFQGGWNEGILHKHWHEASHLVQRVYYFTLGRGRDCFLNVLQTCSCTLAHATSWEVDRAHWVAAAMTRFCSTVSSATWATFLAFSTNMAAALATALARFIRMSYKNSNQVAQVTQTISSATTYSCTVCPVTILSLSHQWMKSIVVLTFTQRR